MNRTERYKIAIWFVALLVVFCSCTKNEHSNREQTTSFETSTEGGGILPDTSALSPHKEYEEGTYALFVYMCGSDLETRSGSASKNIAEMLSADIPENVKVVVQTGGAKRWRNFDIPEDKSNRYEIKNGSLVLLESNPPANMGISSTLSDFLLWGDKNFPAQHRGVILWDHGGGSVKGVCTDEQFNHDTLTLSEMGEAFEYTFKKSGRKYNFVGLDACLMATYDTACVLAPYGEYMIASEDLEPTSGWDYKTVVESLASENFYSNVLSSYATKQSSKATYTLSVTDLSQLHIIDRLVCSFSQKLASDIQLVQKTLKEGKEFGSSGELRVGTDLFDLGFLLDSVSIPHNLGDIVITANGEANEGAGGISLYFPVDREEKLDAYKNICPNDTYFAFLQNYFSYHPEHTIAFENPGFDNGGKLSFTLTPDSEPCVVSTGYILHSLNVGDGEPLYCIGYDTDVSCSNGVYTAEFNGNWVFLNDKVLHTSHYEEGEDCSVFCSPVLVEEKQALLLFTYHKQTSDITVEGYTLMGDITSRIYELKAGTSITILYEDVNPKDKIEYYEEETLIWDDDTELSVQKLAAGKYQCIPYVVDIYANFYYGYTALIDFNGDSCIIENIAAG